MADTYLIFAAQPDYRAPVEALRRVADEVELFGGRSVWTRLEAALPDGTTLTFAPLPQDRPEDEGSKLMAMTADYFRAIQPAEAAAVAERDRLVREIGQSRWVVRLEAEPEMGEAAFPAIGVILGALGGMLFDGTGMVGSDGTLRLDADGSTDVGG